MKIIFFVLIALIFAKDDVLKRTNEIIETVNSGNYGWKAGHNRFSLTSNDEMKFLLTTPRPHNSDVKLLKPMKQVYNAPDAFDARDQWPNCETIGNIRDQAHCGSCWAFAGSEVLSDRFCTIKQMHVLLSPQDLVSCDKSDAGCNGGRLGPEWKWMTKHGIALDSCIPYTSQNGTVEKCPAKCVDGSDIVRYKAKSYQHVGWTILHREKEIKEDLYEYGSMEVAFTVYEDFKQYKSGIYRHVTGGILGGHAVKLVGYGSENGNDYWLIANSWNTGWGEKGFFRIRRGHNECGIEAQAYSCMV